MENRLKRYTTLILLALISLISAHGQIIINEFLCSNASGLINNETKQFSDWIELYNTNNQDVDMEGFFLSDENDSLAKWRFPANTIIPANGFILVYPDKLNKDLHLNFGLSKNGESIYLSDPNGVLHDFIEFGKQKPDVSYGRKPGNLIEWAWFGEPTPGEENNSHFHLRPSENNPPDVSPDAGFYESAVEVVLDNISEETVTIRYTTDGSTPTSSSLIFPQQLLVEKTSVIKLRAFSIDKMPSKIVAKTYFVGEETSLPVFSLSINPEYLWDEETGIYVDGSNFNGNRSSRNCCQTDWERPIIIEFFEDNKQLVFSEQAGVQVKGRMNCEFPKKPLGIYFRSKYGNNHINHAFFAEKPIAEFSSFILRPGGADGMGNCYNGTMIRDGLLSTLLIDQMDIDYEGYRPAVLYINGKYWGIHNIRERNKKDYLATNHGVDPDNLDILENPANGGIIKGDDLHYMGLLNFVRTGEVAEKTGLTRINQLIDLQELLNYQIAEIFVNNEDWAHNNVLCWRPRITDGKWRWVFYDVEGGFGLYHADDYTNNLFGFDEDSFLKHAFLFRRLLMNPDIKTDFLQGFAAHLNTTFKTDRVIQMIDSLSQDILDEMPKDVQRWKDHTTNGGSGCSPINSMEQWMSHLAIMKNFAKERPDIIRQQIIDRYDLSGMAEITFEAAGGSITLNGIENAASGSYFKDLSLKLTAIPDIGYHFVGWEGFSSEKQITINLTNDILIKAIFAHSEESVLPSIITDKLVLNADNSPYLGTSDIIIEEDAVFRIGPGVEILMPENASIYVYGIMQVVGEPENPVRIAPNPNSNGRWGALVFDHAQEGSVIHNLEINQASVAHQNPALYKANLNIINTFVPINGLRIPNADKNPLYTLESETIIRNSIFFSSGTGDYINIAKAPLLTIESCIFSGNQAPDTDAIDLDAVGTSSILNNKFRNFTGANSDGLDVGYSSDILIEGNVFSNISDKGISVGMGSSIRVFRNLFLNCNDGIGVKDIDSKVEADRNTFFSNKTGVHCFEKEPGRGGGTANVVNSIFAGGYQDAGFADSYSNINYNYSWSDNSELPGKLNQFGNPDFLSPQTGIFRLSDSSECREAGDPDSQADPDGTRADIGAYYFHTQQMTDIFLNEIITNDNKLQIEIFNSSEHTIDCNELIISSGGIGWDEVNLSQWSGSDPYLAPNDFKLFSIPADKFSFKKKGDILLLLQSILTERILLSSIPFSNYLGTYSIGYFPDGSSQIRHFSQPSPGWSNQAEPSGQGQIFINEVLANNQSSITDEEDQNEDWVELYNSGNEDYLLGGLYFTDNLNNPTKHQIPASMKNSLLLPSRGFTFFWADADANAGANHLNFKLDADKEEIGLFKVIHPDTLLIDSLLFVNQIPDKSYGRFPDGSDILKEFSILTPGESNVYLHVADSQNFFDLTLYPNPCTDRLNVKLHGIIAPDTRFEIININGQVLSELNLYDINYGTTSIDVSHLLPGMYIIRVISSKKVRTARLIKE
ncbi:MAG: CotH kinase family protein [Bacteroidales bacterium]|nr:CotH kinase family protein [Bacteroidales bacterium]